MLKGSRGRGAAGADGGVVGAAGAGGVGGDREALLGGADADVPPEFAGAPPAVYAAMCAMGVGLLMPWNAVVNSMPWVASLYPGPTGAESSFWLTSVYSYPGLPILFLMVRYGDALPLSARIVGSFLAQAAVLAVFPLAAPPSVWGPLALMFVNGLVLMLLQSSLLGMQAQLPPRLSNALSVGMGLSGVLSSAVQVALMAASAASPAAAAGAYFALAAALEVGCAAAYVWMRRHPYVKFYAARAADAAAAARAAAAGAEGGAAKGGDAGGGGGGGGGADDEGEAAVLVRGGALNAPEGDAEAVDVAGARGGGGRGACCARELGIAARVWRGCASLFLIYVATFLVFPGLLVAIPYRGGFGPRLAFLATTPGAWPVALVAVFNCLDTVGRVASGRAACLPEAGVLPAVLARFALAPALLAAARGSMPTAAGGDALALCATAALGLSNGYLTSLSFMYAPAHVRPEQRETAGFLLSLCLNVGLAVGSQLALALR